MNLQGDFRYATPADTASIAALEPDLKGAAGEHMGISALKKPEFTYV